MRDKRLLQHHDGLSVTEADELPYFEFVEYKKLLAEDLQNRSKQAEEQNAQMSKTKSTPKKHTSQLRASKIKNHKFR